MILIYSSKGPGFEFATDVRHAPERTSYELKTRRCKLDQVRQRFRLTSMEKRVVLFVVAAFVLGLVTKCYRDAHPSPPLSQSDSQ
jgi:hypothetical protein